MVAHEESNPDDIGGVSGVAQDLSKHLEASQQEW